MSLIFGFNRKAMKGRDFYDVVFLFSKTTPNYEYLQLKMDIATEQQLKMKLLTLEGNIDLNVLANNVKPFLFNADDAKRVTLFMNYIKDLKLS